jgi:hypothetical protein
MAPNTIPPSLQPRTLTNACLFLLLSSCNPPWVYRK